MSTPNDHRASDQPPKTRPPLTAVQQQQLDQTGTYDLALTPGPHQMPWHDVQVHWPDGSTHLDGIRGHNREHALDNARWNWISGNPYGHADRIEYLGVSDDQTDPADGYTPPDWWDDTSVPSDRDEDVL